MSILRERSSRMTGRVCLRNPVSIEHARNRGTPSGEFRVQFFLEPRIALSHADANRKSERQLRVSRIAFNRRARERHVRLTREVAGNWPPRDCDVDLVLAERS